MAWIWSHAKDQRSGVAHAFEPGDRNARCDPTPSRSSAVRAAYRLGQEYRRRFVENADD